MSVLFEIKTLIFYTKTQKILPQLYTAVIACNCVPISAQQQLPKESLYMMDYWYARDYEPSSDIKMIWRMYRRLGG